MEADEKKRILIIDDDPTYAKMVREWLKEEFHVFVVVSGAQASTFFGKNTADLILLDIEMPVVNGPQVMNMLRKDVKTASIPVIFLTGVGDKASMVQAMSLRPSGYILKAAGREELLQQIRKTLGQ